jgi:hypothetical protein
MEIAHIYSFLQCRRTIISSQRQYDVPKHFFLAESKILYYYKINFKIISRLSENREIFSDIFLVIALQKS